jgi:hypothetical protein
MAMRVLQGATFIWSRVMEVWLGSPKVNIEETAVLSAAPGRPLFGSARRWPRSRSSLHARPKVVELRYFGGFTEEQIA